MVSISIDAARLRDFLEVEIVAKVLLVGFALSALSVDRRRFS